MHRRLVTVPNIERIDVTLIDSSVKALEAFSVHELCTYKSIYNGWLAKRSISAGYDDELGVNLPLTEFSEPIERIVLYKLFKYLPEKMVRS